MSSIISIENLGKRYTIRHRYGRPAGGYRRLSEELMGAAKAPFRALSSRLRGDRVMRPDEEQRVAEDFWALRNVSFEIKEGDVLGVIGRNGAGKSTLLKILSRITEPSEGRVRVRGRVASLLEVGTGFHPELTGRENIFLNGAILGMSRAEIRRKFEEIVAFAEVERFLDTPVKRYSSGMYVRLAFAVAAHLDPEILIVDEVLAVGDAQFQRRCLGKMQEVSSEQGRTVLFVSHNMSMISSLCATAVLLDQGRVRMSGTTSDVILGYSNGDGNSPASVDYIHTGRIVGDEDARLLSAVVCSDDGSISTAVDIGRPFLVRMDYRILSSAGRRFVPNFHFHRADGSCAFVSAARGVQAALPGDHRAECCVPANFLNDGLYSVGLALSSFESGVRVHFFDQGALMFNVRDPIEGVVSRDSGYAGSMPGAVRPLLDWTIQRLR